MLNKALDDEVSDTTGDEKSGLVGCKKFRKSKNGYKKRELR